MNGGALINGCRRSLLSPCFFTRFISSTILCRRATHSTSNAYASQTNPSSYSPFESKMQRILSSEIQYQCDYAPPHQAVAEYDRFMVEDRPGEQWITLRGKSENIKIEATMFDGFIVDQRKGVQLHINMSVEIWKGEGNSAAMKFVCSAWPDSLEIHKVFINRDDDDDESPAPLYMGPHFKNLNTKLQSGFYQFLSTRGVNDGLSLFLHKYMMNKDRIELIQWLRKVNCFFNN